MKKYLVIIEKTRTGYSAFSPDLPGCIATARTKISIEKRMHEVIEFHIEGMQIEGKKIPKAHSYSKYLTIVA